MSDQIPATLIAGDGIGPEIVDATLAALDALGAPFQWDTQIAGIEGVKAAGDPLPPKTIDSIKRTRLALKGPLETPLNIDKVRTGDLGGRAGSAGFTRTLVSRIVGA